ncbi:MAG: glycosyltransferase family 9 protein [Gammaproteobacteria bacterium]|nr:glycosyltransferase family 9 protein [Gammaproteobacteria bacterium]
MPAPPLVVRCGAFGDIVLLTPLLRLLAARHGSTVDLVSSGAWTAPLLADEPSLGHLQLVSSRHTPYFACPSQWSLVRWLRRRGRGPVYLCDVNPEMRALLARGGVLDADIVARDPADAPPIPWPDRWLELGMRDPPHGWPTHPVDPASFRLPRLVVSAGERRQLAAWLAGEGLDGPLVLFQPGNKRTHKRGKLLTAGHPKHWDAANWATLAAAVLAEVPGARVLLCGSGPERPVLEDIHDAAGRHPRIHNLAGALPVPRLLALLEVAHSMVSVDTGPAHAAAALGCPLVVMFGPAPPAQWCPLGPGAIIALGGERGPDSRVSDIPAAAVVDAWRRLPTRPAPAAAAPDGGGGGDGDQPRSQRAMRV